MTTDEAMNELRAARADLYEASSERARLALSRNRVLAEIQSANTRIATARTRAADARTALQAALAANDPAPEVPQP
jgi:uncharacterized protein (DUF3084 family)